jgi:hypothetical protein
MELAIVYSKITEAVSEYQILCDTVECMEVKDDITLKNAIEMGSKINKFEKALEEKRKETVKPLNEEVKKINGMFKPVVDNVSKLNDTLKAKILPYQKAVEEKRKAWVEAQRKKEIEEMEARKAEMLKIAEEQNNELALDMAVNIETEQKAIEEKAVNVKTIVKAEDGAKSTITRTWVFEVTDEKALPRFCLMLDEKIVKQLMKDNKKEIEAGTYKIEGIRFYQKEDLRY